MTLTVRYAQNVILMQAGKVIKTGNPSDVITKETIETVFQLTCERISCESQEAVFVPMKKVIR